MSTHRHDPAAANPLIMLGWREWVALPQLGIAAMRGKIDTGARSSVLRVEAQWRFSEQGAPWVGFRVRMSSAASIEASAVILDEREVSDSGGHRTRRVFLHTLLQLAECERMIEINLSDRAGQRFPLLLGRTALAGLFTVDPQASFLHRRPLRDDERKPLDPGSFAVESRRDDDQKQNF